MFYKFYVGKNYTDIDNGQDGYVSKICFDSQIYFRRRFIRPSFLIARLIRELRIRGVRQKISWDIRRVIKRLTMLILASFKNKRIQYNLIKILERNTSHRGLPSFFWTLVIS